MRRPWQIWFALAACFAVSLAALGFLTLKSLELDRAELAARRQAELEENVRLALWRMDTAIAPILSLESSRPWTDYRPLPSGLAPPGRRQPDEPLTPSPLLTAAPGEVLLHFEITDSGQLLSPQAPELDVIPRLSDLPPKDALRIHRQRLGKITAIASKTNLWDVVPSQLGADDPVIAQQEPPTQQMAQAFSPEAQRARGVNEFQARSQIVAQNNSILNMERFNYAPAGSPATVTPMTPTWAGKELLLLRRVTVAGEVRLQGCWLNWPLIESQLLSQVRDLLPAPRLVKTEDTAEATRRLATLPLELRISPAMAITADGWSPTKLALISAWSALLLVAVALVLLVRGILALSERRASFVSAVTHELRTPLTTFRMYTEMLLDGMVPSEHRQRYLATLHSEADRLTHLVENVLAYARLEGNRQAMATETVTVGRLLDDAHERLSSRASQAGLELHVEGCAATRDATLRTNPLAVEQILFNLVDNACKYAASSNDRTLRLFADAENGTARFEVQDCGPGIDPSVQRRLFEPFHKTAHEAANTAAGVGLGLALSRRLARQMGGDLRLVVGQQSGSCFELTLPTDH
jgi:signal transduction histidine kinase